MKTKNSILMIPKKLRPPQMWWVIEQQARRRRAVHDEPPAAAVPAEWLPHDAVVGWSTSDGFVSGDWDAFSAVDPASVLTLELEYSGAFITGVTGLESLTALQALSFTYGTVEFALTALPASLETLSLYYNYITSLPDLTSTPNLIFLEFGYAHSFSDEQKVSVLLQLDANNKSDGYVNVHPISGGTPGLAEAVANLTSKGWTVNV